MPNTPPSDDELVIQTTRRTVMSRTPAEGGAQTTRLPAGAGLGGSNASSSLSKTPTHSKVAVGSNALKCGITYYKLSGIPNGPIKKLTGTSKIRKIGKNVEKNSTFNITQQSESAQITYYEIFGDCEEADTHDVITDYPDSEITKYSRAYSKSTEIKDKRAINEIARYSYLASEIKKHTSYIRGKIQLSEEYINFEIDRIYNGQDFTTQRGDYNKTRQTNYEEEKKKLSTDADAEKIRGLTEFLDNIFSKVEIIGQPDSPVNALLISQNDLFHYGDPKEILKDTLSFDNSIPDQFLSMTGVNIKNSYHQHLSNKYFYVDAHASNMCLFDEFECIVYCTDVYWEQESKKIILKNDNEDKISDIQFTRKVKNNREEEKEWTYKKIDALVTIINNKNTNKLPIVFLCCSLAKGENSFAEEFSKKVSQTVYAPNAKLSTYKCIPSPGLKFFAQKKFLMNLKKLLNIPEPMQL